MDTYIIYYDCPNKSANLNLMVALARKFVGALSAGAPIDAPGGIDVSQVGYACIINVCIYRRAGSTWSTICVCMHACITYACMYTNRRGDRYSARRSSRWVVVVCLKLKMHVL